MRTPINNTRTIGFTLIEMLTVVGIITLLVALVTPTLVDVIRSTRLNSAGDALVGRLSLAQQSAISLNTEVELRFYQYMDVNSDLPTQNAYYAYQVVQTTSNGVDKLISENYYFESGITLSKQPTLSPLLQTSATQSETTDGRFMFNPTAAGVQPQNVEYAAFRFYPDGSLRVLSSTTAAVGEEAQAMAYTIPEYDESFITLIESRDEGNVQPVNFYCIQIDSYTGKTRVYRP